MLEKALQDYLDSALGLHLEFHQWPEVADLPPYLRERYTFLIAELFDTPCVFMFDREPGVTVPSVIARQHATVENRSGYKAVYVASSTSAVLRSRLVAAKLPFVVPGKQLYLPPLGIDFRELFSSPKPALLRLGIAAQIVALNALLEHRVELGKPSVLAAGLGYTKMTMGRAFDELIACGVAEDRRSGRARTLLFKMQGRELWNNLLPLLCSPVRKCFYADATGIDLSVLAVSGLSALSSYTELAPPAVPIYAVPAGSETLKALEASRLPYPDMGCTVVEVEVWKYDPHLVSDGDYVDELSLYVSLLGEVDERVRAACDSLLEVL